jgi:hypothetical protein
MKADVRKVIVYKLESLNVEKGESVQIAKHSDAQGV